MFAYLICGGVFQENFMVEGRVVNPAVQAWIRAGMARKDDKVSIMYCESISGVDVVVCISYMVKEQKWFVFSGPNLGLSI